MNLKKLTDMLKRLCAFPREGNVCRFREKSVDFSLFACQNGGCRVECAREMRACPAL